MGGLTDGRALEKPRVNTDMLGFTKPSKNFTLGIRNRLCEIPSDSHVMNTMWPISILRFSEAGSFCDFLFESHDSWGRVKDGWRCVSQY